MGGCQRNNILFTATTSVLITGSPSVDAHVRQYILFLAQRKGISFSSYDSRLNRPGAEGCCKHDPRGGEGGDGDGGAGWVFGVEKCDGGDTGHQGLVLRVKGAKRMIVHALNSHTQVPPASLEAHVQARIDINITRINGVRKR